MIYYIRFILITIGFACSVGVLGAKGPTQIELQNPNQMRLPVRSEQKIESIEEFKFPENVRSIDGSHNNLANSAWGQSDIPFLRLAPVSYADGKTSLSRPNSESPRVISNSVVKMDGDKTPLGASVSDMFWQWGQFLDHDLTLTPEVAPAERADIAIPVGDPWFDPNAQGSKVMHFGRSIYSVDTSGVRQQHNFISAYIDASNVYGSDVLRASALRTNDGTGRLKVSAGNLLPFNVAGLPNAPSTSVNFFLAGDFRANEQIGLTALHTIFVREHNRIANNLRLQNPAMSGEDVYQHSRALVGGIMQVITYTEFLP